MVLMPACRHKDGEHHHHHHHGKTKKVESGSKVAKEKVVKEKKAKKAYGKKNVKSEAVAHVAPHMDAEYEGDVEELYGE